MSALQELVLLADCPLEKCAIYTKGDETNDDDKINKLRICSFYPTCGLFVVPQFRAFMKLLHLKSTITR